MQKADGRKGGRRLSRCLGCLLVLLVLALTAAPLPAETVTCRDKLGRTVSIPLPVRRAVFFQMYELIPVLGVWDRVAGIGRWAYGNDLMRAARPDIEKTVPSAGSGSDVNAEALLAMRPDIVITWTFKPEQVRFMEDRGLLVLSLYPESLPELYEAMKIHGKIFQKEREIKGAIARMERIFTTIRKRVSKVPAGERQKVLWVGSKPNTVACRIGVTNDILNLIGAINPAASLPQRNADVSLERIIEWNPDVVFIWGNATYGVRDILNNPQWQSVRAVQSGRVYKAPEWSTWSPRLAPVSLWMAMKTYPSYFRDIDFESTADSFYRKVFGIPYGRVKRIED